ncbi:histidinol-phosphate phosphatase family domain-containing protein/HAD-superfamily hydrolase, subfamily IIIA [Acetanaerobacterium elongatum]|uniref:D,D-heptose 1,7-bisphosphate phosphatase n=2 Tax=Acetanaerobacterium elongatum TaxID=258515 RepID=A0A1G9V6S0_9FIRM|nr:histidinol-phosphate phosphatase family domain-containing protein/HAD-superfamily hydrolase, subfamily IIIA [Acetanaerobacterium elongatum]
MKAVFIDRDGTIGGGNDVTLPKDFQRFPFTQQALELLKNHGFMLIAFTNQPDISRGKCRMEDFEQELATFGFDDTCICPHQQEENCRCRKPGTLMITEMAKKYKLNLSECFVIGDRWSDMLAGMRAGTKTVLVLTGAGRDALGVDRDKWDSGRVSYIADDLLAACKWIIRTRVENDMKRYSKASLIGIIISLLAVLISVVNIIYCAINGEPMNSAITILCSTIAILCSNIAIAESNKKKPKELARSKNI